MEAWPKLKDESALHEVEIDHASDWGNEFSSRFAVEDWVFDGCKKKLRFFFDQILVDFLKDVSKDRCFRPIPVMNGDGQEVDLFKLYSIVRKIGGYDAVSGENMWGFVAEQCGLSFGEIAFLKLTYIKYLKEFDQWTRRQWSEGNLENIENGVVRRLEMLARELELKFRNNMFEGIDVRKRSAKSFFLENGDLYREFDLFALKKDDSICSSNTKQCIIRVGDQLNSDMKNGGEVLIDVGIASVCDDYVESAKKLAVKNVDKSIVHNNTKLIVPSAEGKTCFSDFDRDQPIIDGENDINYAASSKKIVQKVLDAVPDYSQGQLDDEKKCYDEDNVVATKTKNLIERAVNKTVAVNKMHNFPKKVRNEQVRVSCSNAYDPLELSKDVVEEVHIRKRKQASSCFSGILDLEAPSCFLGMLDWVTSAAKHSDDPKIGKIPNCSKWRDHTSSEFWVQVLWLREVLLNKKRFNLNSVESNPQKKLKMHPSMYEDDTPINHLSTEKTRCSKRILSLTKPGSCCRCYSCSATDNKVVSPQKGGTKIRPKKSAPLRIELSATDTASDISGEEELRGRKVSVGPRCQAEIPEWNGVVSESDSKYLGTQMWPPEETKTVVLSDNVGKGRQEGPCDCPFPSSVQCIRFHIAENRHRLKLELGKLFYQWRFDRMGEIVSLSWTEEEEERFKSLMKLNAKTPENFWNSISKFFPSKTEEMVVSYYFNVYLIKRQSYQNRVTPKNIDSEDDENKKEFGSIGGSFGCEAIHVPGSSTILCTENKVCTDLE